MNRITSMSTYIRSLTYFFILIFTLVSCKPNNVSQEPIGPVPFIQGAFFHGANGIYFDDADQLHVASVVSRYIGVVNTDTGAILDTLGIDDGVEGPDDLTFGPDGSLYYTSILTGEVGRIAPDGTVTMQFVAPGTNPITFSDDGRLFVALDFQGDGLYELDPNLQDPPRLIIKELGWLNGMDFGPDGNLYGPIWSKGQIVKIDVDKATLTVVVDDLKTPAAVKFDSKGNLFTVDHQTGIVYQVDINNGEKKVIAKGFVGADNIAFNSKDELFLSSAQDGSIHQIHMDGTSRTIIEPTLCNATDVEIVDGELIAPDILSMKKYNLETGEQTKVWHHMIGTDGIMGPFTADHEDDKLIMTSWFGNEVQVWDLKEDKALFTDFTFAVPLNAILNKGDIIVAELGTAPGAAKVSRQIDGKRETLIDAAGGLIVPAGLAASGGNIFVSDFYSGNVFQVTENDAVLTTPKIVVSDLKQPEGMQIGPNGRLIIAETGANQVIAIDLTSGDKEVLVDNIPMGTTGPANMAPTWVITDVHFDKDGNLYVPSDVDNVVYKIAEVLK